MFESGLGYVLFCNMFCMASETRVGYSIPTTYMYSNSKDFHSEKVFGGVCAVLLEWYTF